MKVLPDKPCLCESDKLLKDCCLRSNGIIRVKPTKTPVPPPKTGYANLGCYFNSFHDCSTKLSSEHFITHGVIKLLSDNGQIKINGFAWQPDPKVQKTLPTTVLTGKILCTRHNEALSPLDTVAIRFFGTFLRISKEFQNPTSKSLERMYAFNGHDIERWMLKTLIGTVVSGNANDQEGNRIKNFKPSTEWLQILLGRRSFPGKWGVYFKAPLGETANRKEGFSFAALGNPTDGTYGAVFTLNGYGFALAMKEPPANRDGTILKDHTFRPYELQMRYEDVTKTLLLTWDIKGENQNILIVYNQIIPPLTP
jgi:hypothetical protein